jgi:hypothetical protein
MAVPAARRLRAAVTICASYPLRFEVAPPKSVVPLDAKTPQRGAHSQVGRKINAAVHASTIL